MASGTNSMFKDENDRSYFFPTDITPDYIDKINTQYVYFLIGTYDERNKLIVWDRRCFASYITTLTDSTYRNKSYSYFLDEIVDEDGSITGTKNKKFFYATEQTKHYIENIPLENYKLDAYTNLNSDPTILFSPINRASITGPDRIDIGKLLPNISNSAKLISKYEI